MRVLMVSWEFPPVVVGGLGRHVHALARELVVLGHEVVVLSRAPAGTDAGTHPTVTDTVDGVRVLRVAEDPPHLEFGTDLVAWTLGMGHGLLRHALTALLPGWRPDVVHAHDWLVAHPAIALADVLGVPLVTTLHATEAGRHSGWLPGPMNRQVHSTEWWLAQRADEVITCSSAMRAEVAALYDLDADDVHVVHNGIDPGRWRTRGAAPVPSSSGPRLVYFGRLEFEKGVQDLIAALPRIRRRHPGTRLLVAGTGTQAAMLAERAAAHRVRRSVDFLGHLPDADLTALLRAADAVVLPSRYEPFGIVALEAAAVGATLVASTAGGLGEVVRDGETGLAFTPGDLPGIADAVDRALADPRAARRRARAARARLRTDFAWPTIAERTAAIYAGARAADPHDLARPKIPTGNLFDRS
ncbi:Glycosyltransferase [Pseudonocardia sp. Ae168_Ps1]|uniref:glycosyltransferase family 4 protein n=1 Tax=unclassified Pseudonocardia TaxID=2619320 RepID=UPI00094B532E|nr:MULTISPECIES: glycosyltransferase family 4 protein [unclassified Pseudonocardia]OLL73737.1 Glycosyltransferase [Pseudonocardia sp. Ae150A_Ps1]OLL79715.1 Glycosyltransferase [Pseudonocardia sp. Ae168_Ps1]OLL86149.1 Glycosyltransferase [Pseudonocardia sp. Ae263_Ps1]OLL93820.1 Glycosyltransferase [Pseudonocardia sp. Ae356_Ps1]